MKIKILSILALLLTMTQGAWADDKAEYGVLNGEFSVSAGKKVHFSRGNLRAYYHLAEVWAWSFAMNQYDYVGDAMGNTVINGKGSLSSTDQSVDLFGWSTSSTSYGIYNSEDKSEYSGSLLDWGTNAITNGGSKANIWYTPSQDEWTYLMSTRSTTTTNMPTGTNSDHARYIKAQVASKNGLILFPDNFAHPAGASVSVSSAAYNTANKGYDSFTVNAENWTKMEEAGAVFLPAGGYRHGTGIIYAGTYGAYWSSTSTSSDKGTSMDFSSSTVEAYNTNRSTGCSVRLVIESHTITYNANGGAGSVDVLPKYTGLDRTLSDGTGLSRSGYILDGWATAADGDVVYGPGATYTEDADVTLYAHWTPVNDVTWDDTDEEKSNWTIAPVSPVAAGAAVTATYSGSRHVKSVTYRPVPTIGGKFTINASGNKVYFAKGNLRYVSGAWSFFDTQDGYYSAYNADAWDKFCWVGASGNLASETPGKWGVNTSVQVADYGTVVNEDLASDWGNVPGIGTGWRTLSWDEWNYLLGTRTVNGGRGAGYSYTLDQSVNNTPGSVLYPDDYTGAPYTTGANWADFEAAGCVFLPAAGWRHSTSVGVIGTDGRYWSSTASSPEGYACCLSLESDGYSKAVCARYYGSCIRLVFPAE